MWQAYAFRHSSHGERNPASRSLRHGNFSSTSSTNSQPRVRVELGRAKRVENAYWHLQEAISALSTAAKEQVFDIYDAMQAVRLLTWQR